MASHSIVITEPPIGDIFVASNYYSRSNVNDLLNRLSYKLPVKAATTGNISLASATVIDGVTLNSLDRVLVKDQINTGENGIYYLGLTGLTRALDYSSSLEYERGAVVLVASGAINAHKLFHVEPIYSAVINTTPVVFKVHRHYIDDVTDITASGKSLININHNLSATIDPNTTTGYSNGSLWFNNTNGGIFRFNGTNWTPLTNSSQVAIGQLPDGTPLVAGVGSLSANLVVRLDTTTLGNILIANSSNSLLAAHTLGINKYGVPDIGDGVTVVTSGLIKDINTSAFSIGARLYFNHLGQLTATPPTAGFLQCVGRVIKADAFTGVLEVKIEPPIIL
jgi:hypothetical protein